MSEMQGEDRRDWVSYIDSAGGVPRGYAVEFGTGRLVPLSPPARARLGAKRAVRKGG